MSCPITADASTRRRATPRVRTARPLVAALAVLALAACERATMGDPSAAPAPLAAPAAELSGAPAPPAAEAPSAPPPSSSYVPPDAPTAAPSPPRAEIVAMEPIPNPPEPSRPSRREEASSTRFDARRHVHRRHRRLVATGRSVAVSTPHVRRPALAPRAAVVSAPAVVERRAPIASPAAAPASVPPTDDRSVRLAALQGALAHIVQADGRLDVARDMTPDRPSDITLTLPAQFADAVRREAGRQGLSEAAASVSLTARLAGDGYTAMPDDGQTQPLQSDRPTRFHWTVISQSGARGPLQANVSAQLLGGGADSLDLGVVKPQVQTVEGWRALGVGLLALALLAAVAWLGRSRRPRPRPDLRPSRPLDMGDGRRL